MAVKQLLGMFLVFALNIWISAAAEEASTDSDAPPYTFVKGQPGKASQINDNFKGIYQRVGELERLLTASEKATTAAVDCTENPSALREFFATDAAASNSTSITVTITGSCLGGLFWIAKVVTLIGADSDAKIYTPARRPGPQSCPSRRHRLWRFFRASQSHNRIGPKPRRSQRNGIYGAAIFSSIT